jgi:hypothetical protein
MDSTFNTLEFGSSVPSVVYVEGLVGWLYLDRSTEIARYQQVFEFLCSLSLSPRKSLELMTEVGKEHNADRSLSASLSN